MAIKLRKFSKEQSAEAMEKWAYKVARDYNSEIKGILESGGSKSQILDAMDEEIKKICKQLDKKEDREFSEEDPKYIVIGVADNSPSESGIYYHPENYKIHAIKWDDFIANEHFYKEKQPNELVESYLSDHYYDFNDGVKFDWNHIAVVYKAISDDDYGKAKKEIINVLNSRKGSGYMIKSLN